MARGLVAAVVLGVMAGGFVATGSFPLVGCGGGEGEGSPFPAQSGELPTSGRVRINLGCGDLAVTTGSGSGWTIEGTSEQGEPPSIQREDDGMEVEVDRGGGLFGFGTARNSWRIVLPTEPSIGLDVAINAGEGDLDLGGAHLSTAVLDINAGSGHVDLRGVERLDDLDVSVNAGSATVWLPDRTLEGELSVNAGSIAICAPEGAGLRLRTNDNPTGSNDFGAGGLVRVGDAWETPDFSSAGVRIALDTEANAGSLSLNSADECAG